MQEIDPNHDVTRNNAQAQNVLYYRTCEGHQRQIIRGRFSYVTVNGNEGAGKFCQNSHSQLFLLVMLSCLLRLKVGGPFRLNHFTFDRLANGRKEQSCKSSPFRNIPIPGWLL